MSTENENHNIAATCVAAQRLVNHIADNFSDMAICIKNNCEDDAVDLFNAIKDDLITLDDMIEWLQVHTLPNIHFSGAKTPYWLG